jgi:hypothetical protein
MRFRISVGSITIELCGELFLLLTRGLIDRASEYFIVYGSIG